MIGNLLKLILISFMFASSAFGQILEVNIEPDSGTGSELFMLIVSIKGKINKISAPSLNRSQEFIITSSGTSTRNTIINGAASSELSFNFELSPRADLPPGEYDSPSGFILIDGNKVEIPAKKITIVNNPNQQKKAKEAIKINQFTDKEVAYVGEQITYTVQVISGPEFMGGNLDDIQVLGFWREKLGDQEKKVFNAGSKTITTFQEVLIPNKAGEIEIPSRKLHAQIEGPARRVRMGGLPSFFEENFFGGMSIMTRTAIKKDFATVPITIKVKALPPSDIKGYIPVGNLNLKSSLDKKSVKKGESINLKIRLSGFANLRPVEIEKPNDDNFKIYIDPAETNLSYEKARVRFTKIFNVSLIPNLSGELKIPEFKFNYFDPLDEKYKTLSTEPELIIAEGNFDERTKQEEIKQEEPIEEEIQAETTELLSSNLELNLKTSIYAALTITFLASLISYALYSKKRTSNSKKINALALALEAINKNADLSQILKNYLSNKLGKNISSYTLKEIQKKIFDTKLKNTERSNEIISKLENSIYNPNKNIESSLKEELVSFIKDIDHEI